jgi:hypothetical protein
MAGAMPLAAGSRTSIDAQTRGARDAAQAHSGKLKTSGKTAGDGVGTAARLRDQDIGVAARTLTQRRRLRKIRVRTANPGAD